MKAGLFGQQLGLMDELRAASFLTHARIQTAPFFPALAACQLPLESYVGQLRAMSVIHGVLERALESCRDERVAAVWIPDMRKLALLQQDLQFFEPRAVPDIREAVDAAIKTAEDLRLRALDQPYTLLGCIYVLEGSTLGARVLRPLYAKAFLLDDDAGLNYLRCYGDAAHSHWERYRQRMNALNLSPEEREQVSQAANALFVQLEAIYQALYPVRPESRTYLVTSINPEAGRHPIPGDEREVQAALRAADRCWRQFPYYEQRYGERGRRFARSDAAWLATLYDFEPAQISRQVRWLGRVLAGRGMPTLLLQVQLEQLVEELTAAVPEKQSDFEKLLLATAELRASRDRHLSDAQVRDIVREFDHSADPQWCARIPNAGILLAAAVADETEGAGNAVNSIRDWMIDANRFPASWIDAVNQCIAQARAQVTNPLQPDISE